MRGGAGALRERVKLESRGSVTQDGAGQDVISWKGEGTVGAAAVPLSAREHFAAAQVQQESTMRFRIRRRDDVAATWRLTWRGRRFDVTGATQLGRDCTEILAIEGVKDGR